MAEIGQAAAVAENIIETEKGFYSIVGPGSIRSNSKYNVAVSVHKADEPCEIKITLKGPSYEDAKTVLIEPETTQNIEFKIPTLYEGDYELKAEGIKGLKFQRNEQLQFQECKPIICMQTDKATYKPGDLVQFRILFMNENTRPITMEKPLTVCINDGEKNRLKQWKNIELKNGVYVGRYQLSEQPVLGQWTIDVSEEGRNLESKYFEVDKYVLPKFDCTIETAKDVAIFDSVVNVTVRSKYTYGKAVKGKATVSLKPKFMYFGACDAEKPLAEKTIEIDGKGDVQFKIGEDFKAEQNRDMLLEVVAVMEEALTGNTKEATASVQLHEQRFRLNVIDFQYQFKAGKPIKFQVAVKHLDDTPVLDSKNSVKLFIEKHRGYFRCGLPSENPQKAEKAAVIELTANLNERGIAVFEHSFAEDCESSYSLRCEYLECDSHLGSICKQVETEESKEDENDTYKGLQLSVLTNEPKLSKPVEVQLKSINPIPYFIYTLVGRGKLLKVEYVKLPVDTKKHIIKFEPTFDMVPRVSVFVHFVENKELRFEETNIHFEREFKNFIEITAPAEAQLGEDITLEIKSKSDSYVGLLGVDQSILLLRAGNDLDRDEVFNRLQQFDCCAPWGFGERPGSGSGLAVITNAKFPRPEIVPQICYMSAPMPMLGGAIPKMRLMEFTDRAEIQQENCMAQNFITQVRKEFPENWIFEDVERLTDGKIKIQKTIPDTITSWVITGFALNTEAGLALTKNPSTIKTFRPFFIGTNLPYSLKRGEQFSVPVLIFNYMDQDLEADVTLDNTDQEFKFVETGDDQTKHTKHVKVTANNGGSVNFLICAKKIGQITLKITAVSPLAGDAVHKQLKVEPEGVTVYKNRDFYLHADKGVLSMQQCVTKLDIPKDCVPDSEFIEVSLMGNILSSTISNIDHLVRMPYGCGEQNMVNFVPNILVLWYLDSLEETSTAIEEKAKRFLEIGYQRELTYKHDDGSFSAFGKSDDSGSTWLTAYVVRSFHQSKKYIDIDPQILEDGLSFLANTQAPNGCFPEVGRVVDFAHMNEFGLTAFVLLAFLENTEALEKYEKIIDRGFHYLQLKVKEVKDLYPLAIALYAFQKRRLDIAHELLARLEALAITDGGLKWWTKGELKEDWRASSNDVEITAYVMMTLLEMGNSVLPITKWLITQRNSNGGFASTQDTVVGLWALIKFAEQTGATNPDINIDVNTSTTSKAFHVKKDNSMVVQSWELPKDTREVTFSGKGTGSCIIQIAYKYNIMEKAPKPSFKLSTKVKPKVIPARMSMDVFAEFVPSSLENGNVSNMVVMEVALPSGYVALPETFDKIKEVENVKRVETKDGDTNIVVYFDNLKGSEVKCIPIEAELSHAVAGQKPAPIVIYDYYDSQKRASEFYQIENSLNDINVE